MYDHRTMELDRFVFLVDIVLTVFIFFLAIFSRNFFLVKDSFELFTHLFLIPLILALLLALFSYFGAYHHPRHTTVIQYSWAIFCSLSVTVGTLLTLFFFLKIEYVSRLVVLNFAAMEYFGILFFRICIKKYFSASVKSGKSTLRLLIVGTGERAKELTRVLRQQDDWGLEVVGHVDPEPKSLGKTVGGVPVIGTVDNISQCLKNHVIDEVIIAIPRSLLGDAEPIVAACEEEGIKLRFMADVFNVNVARISFNQVGPIPLLTMEPVAQDDTKLFLKRIFDLSITSLSMPVVLPVLLLVALAIRLESPGPVMFIQQRVGLRKHLFPMLKFRSMVVDAEDKLKEIEHLNEADGPIFKMTDDPRVTKVGRFIRRTSLDELPQLINVLRGEMSLVGPRPMSIRDVELFDRGIQRKRFSVKPGITCLWQISGRSNLPFSKWLELDLEYIEKWTFWLDIKILFKTIPAVVKSKGAV